MSLNEQAFLFDCAGEALPGIIALPHGPSAGCGVLVVVGGPQYRVGSHRQFVLLARHLARNGVPCMRFDYRGMGDASGEARSFEAVGEDIRAALDAFHARVPGLHGVVLWGLCDGASAAAFYAPLDRRVRGLVLLNPWVRTTAGEAGTYLRHYYLRRLFSLAFWKKLAGGGVALGRSLGELGARIAQARGKDAGGDGAAGSAAEQGLPWRLRRALQTAGLPWLAILSGRDYVAREFEQVLAGEAWRTLLPAGELFRLPDADHTFSSAPWRDAVAMQTLDWLRSLSRQEPAAQESSGGRP